MRYVILCALLAGAAFGSEQTEKEYNAAVEKAKAECDQKVKMAREKYVAALKIELADLTKKGDLDGALKVRNQITDLTPDTKSKEPTKTTISGRYYEKFEGKRTWEVVIEDETRIKMGAKSGDSAYTGEIAEEEGNFVIRWGNGALYKLKLDEKGNLVGKNATQNKPVELIRESEHQK